ncbi:MAG: MFS transporter [Pseudomonadota bacterium]|jgi:AAHS family benzoate transporter-like MFS transporter
MRINIQEIADEAPLGAFHWQVLLWCAAIVLIDGYDLAVVGVALPTIITTMKVDPTVAGVMASSALFGMAFGAMCLGAVADRWGRKVTIAVCVFLFSAFTAAAGLVGDAASFCVLRFLAGLGLGGVLPNITAAMTEYAPKRTRSLLTTLMFCGYAMGGVLAALTAKQFIESAGWQSVFLAAGLPLVMIPFILKFMPESLPVLARRGDRAALRAIVARLSPAMQIPSDAEFVIRKDTGSGQGGSLAELFRDGRGFSTVMFWIAFFTGLFMMYALSAWLTKLMAMAGLSLGSALTFTIVFQVGSMVGAVFGGWLGDRYNGKWVLAGMWAVGAIALTAMAYKMSYEAMFVTVALVGATTAGTQALAYAYIGQYYPLAIRSTGIGMASGMGRAGGIVAPIIIGVLVSLNLPLEQNFFAIAIAGAIGAIAVALINHDVSAAERDKKAARVAYGPA